VQLVQASLTSQIKVKLGKGFCSAAEVYSVLREHPMIAERVVDCRFPPASLAKRTYNRSKRSSMPVPSSSVTPPSRQQPLVQRPPPGPQAPPVSFARPASVYGASSTASSSARPASMYGSSASSMATGSNLTALPTRRPGHRRSQSVQILPDAVLVGSRVSRRSFAPS